MPLKECSETPPGTSEGLAAARLEGSAAGEREAGSPAADAGNPQDEAPLTDAAVVAAHCRKLLQHSSHYLIGLVASLLLGFVSFPIFTRVFTVSEYGSIDLISKIVLLLAALAKLGQQQSALRFYDDTDSAGRRRYYSTLYLGVALTAGVTVTLFLGASAILSRFMPQWSFGWLFVLAAVLTFAQAIQSILWSFLRVEERTKLYSVATTIMKAVTIGVICCLLPLLGRSAQTYFSGTAVVQIAVAAIFSVALVRRDLLGFSGFDSTLFRAALAFGLPLIVYEFSGIVLDAGDRILVRYYLGGNALGYYSAAYGLSNYLNDLLLSPLHLALTPIFVSLWNTRGRDATGQFLSRGLRVYAIVSIGLIALTGATARDAVTLLASAKYLGADRLMPMIVAGLLVHTSQGFLSAGLMLEKKTLVLARLVALAAVFNVALNCLLLPRMGLLAAALATLLSYVFCVLLVTRASFRVLPLDFDFRVLGKCAIAGTVAWAATSVVQIGWTLPSLAVRSTLAVLLYVAVLSALDTRTRAGIRDGCRRLAGR